MIDVNRRINLPDWVHTTLWVGAIVLTGVVILCTLACGSMPTLRNKVGTGLNVQDVAEADVNKMCRFDDKGKLLSGPPWCVSCNHALHQNDEATHLGLRAMNNAGTAKWQKRRLKKGRAAVEAACPTVNQ